jgi:hypothetical protein
MGPPAERAGSEGLTDLGACGLLIRFSMGLEADVFFFSAISASPLLGGTNDDMRLYQTGAPVRNRGLSASFGGRGGGRA